MLMQKRPRAFSSSNEINETEWPCSFPIKRERSRLTEEDVRRVIKEELEHANSHSAKYCQSCTGKACEEMMKQMRPMMNSFLKELKEALGLGNIQIPHAGRAHAGSTINNYARNLRLEFQTKLSLPIYTDKILKGEEGTPIYVALINADTGNVVTSGPESSIKLEVVVLEGNFDKEDGDNWTSEEFEDHVVKERDGKRPLLIGNLPVTLKGGVGELGELSFTDNSSWNKSGRFRIGIKVAADCCGNTRIREAKTEAFRVMEYRAAAKGKHYPPASNDEVWRLQKIHKEGKYHLNLKAAGIHTVEDFILQLHTDFQKLREIIGISVTSKNWDILVRHANTCKINRKLYLYHPECMEMHGVIFTLPSQLIGLIKGGEYFASHRLSPQEMKHGDKIVQKALHNWNDVREFNGATFSGSMQKKSSSSSSFQVLEGQTQNLTSFQRGLDPTVLAAQAGLEALPTNVGFTPEGQSQNTNSENFTGFPVDEIAPVAAHQPMSADQNANFGNAMDISFDKVVPFASHQPMFADQNANFGNAIMSSVDQPTPADNSHVVSPGDNGITTVGLPNQSHDTDLRYAMANSTIDPLRSPGHAGYMMHGDSIVQKDLQNWNAVRKFNGAGFSGSMQKKSSSSSSSQVLEGQTQNLTSIQRGLDPPVLAAQFGLEALPTNVGSTSEGQSQNTNSEYFTGFPVDESALVAAHQPMFADQNFNFGNAMMSSVDQPTPAENSHVVSPGDNGITTVGLPNQSHDTDLRYAMAHSTIDPLMSPGHAGYMVSNDVLPSGPTYASTSGCQYSGTCPREGKSTMAEEDTSYEFSLWDY